MAKTTTLIIDDHAVVWIELRRGDRRGMPH